MNTTQLAQQLWERLWLDYRNRVTYARIYQQMIEASQGTFINDHIAFRSLQLTVEGSHGTINLGIPYLEEIITPLGYQPVQNYEFPDKYLLARHYEVSGCNTLPKLFISELKVDALPTSTANLIRQAVRWKPSYENAVWTKLPSLEKIEPENILLLFQSRLKRLWAPPLKSTVEAVNPISQYGAWVLLHGYRVNHFTASINRQNSATYSDLDATVQALKGLGVPMKPTTEGSEKTGLRQTATQAVIEPVTVIDDTTEHSIQIQWPYAYFELAQRYPLSDNTPEVFSGFLSSQATQLFEMTSISSSSRECNDIV